MKGYRRAELLKAAQEFDAQGVLIEAVPFGASRRPLRRRGAQLDGGKDVREGEVLVAEPWRALALFPPDVADTPPLADPGLVLKEEADAFVFLCVH